MYTQGAPPGNLGLRAICRPGCSRFPAHRGASSRRARVTFERASHTRKKTEGVKLRVDRAVVLSAGSTYAPFHLRPRIRRTSGRSIGSTPPHHSGEKAWIAPARGE